MVLETNWLLTGGMEGTVIKTVSLGSKPEFILIYKGHHFDRDYNIVDTSKWEPDDERWKTMGIRLPTVTEALLGTVGLYWVGLPPRRVATYDMAWSEWSHVDKDGKPTSERLIRPRAISTRYFFVRKFGYAFNLKGVETSAGFKVDLKFTVYVKGANPKIALVDNDDWHIQFDGLVRRRVKDFIGAKSFHQLLSEEKKAQELLRKYSPIQKYLDEKHRDKPEKEDAIKKTFSEYLVSMPGKGREKDEAEAEEPSTPPVPLSQVLGVEIVDATFEEIDLDKDEPLRNYMSKVQRQEIDNAAELGKVENEKKIAKTRAEGEAEAMDIITQAKQKRLKVHEGYEGKKLATAVAIAELDASNAAAYADAVRKNTSLKSIVFPGSNTRPVHVVNKDD